MAWVAASEARSFEQWQAALDDRIAATVALGAKRFPEGLGWFAFQDHALEQDYLEYSFATWTRRTKIIARVCAVYWSLLSLASIFDWDWYLSSTGHPTNAVDAIQTHAPTCILLVFNVVLHTPLWSPARFQATLSLVIVLTGLGILLPQILEKTYHLEEPVWNPCDPTHQKTCRDLPPAEWVLEHFPLHTHDEQPELSRENLANYITEELASMQYDTSLHFAGAGCISIVISLVPCGPFAPLGTLLVMVGLVILGALRYRVMTLAHFDMEPPDISAFLYALLIIPVTINALTRQRAERHQFLLFVKSRRQSELQLEQLRSEKERLDYERRFALHQIQRGQEVARGGDDGPSLALSLPLSLPSANMATTNTRSLPGSLPECPVLVPPRRSPTDTSSLPRLASLPPGPPSSSSARSAGEQGITHTVHVAPDTGPRLAPSEAVAGQGYNFVRRFWYQLPILPVPPLPRSSAAPAASRSAPPHPPAMPRIQDIRPFGGKPHVPFGGKPHLSSPLATATSVGKPRLPACASKPAPAPYSPDPDRQCAPCTAPVPAYSDLARVPVLDRLLAELEQIAMVEQMTAEEQIHWREDWTRLTQGRGVLPALMAEMASVDGEVAPEEDTGRAGEMGGEE